MIRGIRSSVSRPFLLFLKADWEILFYMQTEGGRVEYQAGAGLTELPVPARGDVLHAIHNSSFHTDCKPDCKPVCVYSAHSQLVKLSGLFPYFNFVVEVFQVLTRS